jgi:glycosyltransferase involved in cell wall biosynthesis
MELAKAMARQSGQHELWLALSALLPDSIAEIRYEFSDLVPQDRIRVFDAPPSIAELTNNKVKVRAAELIREEFLNSLKPDVIHVSSLFEGLQEDVITSVGKLYSGSNTAVTLYDLIPLVQRDRYLANKDALNHYLGKIDNLKEAGLLLSISEFSRNEAIDVLDITPDHIVNISSAADEKFRPLVIPKSREIQLLKKYGIHRKFLMYTGSFDQRKNQAKLIEAYGLLPGKVRKNYQLVIVGNGWNAIYEDLRVVARRSGLSDDELVFAGHVSDEDLLPLYNLCHLFVFPSLAEGFGLPILEAMSCGTPAIGSNCTSIPEVIGWSEALFDPRNVESIARKMNDALTDAGFYQRLRKHGLEQSKKFSWDESARLAINAFESRYERVSKSFAINTRNTNDQSVNMVDSLAKLEGISALPDGALLEMAQSIASNQYQCETILATALGRTGKLKVGWVTTWNTRCGIAAYSDFLVEHFPAEIAIFASETSETVKPDEANVVRCWQAGKIDDLQLLFNEIKRSNVEVIIVQFNYSFFDFASFSSFLQLIKLNGIRVFVTFHSTYDPSDSKRLVNLKDSLSICDGLIAHSMNDVNTLKKLGLTHNIQFLPQGIIEKKPSRAVKDLQFKEKHVIATYGFALPSKGLKETIEAFSKLLQKHGPDFHLLMVNAEYPDPISATFLGEIRARLKELSIEDHVTLITEYLSDELSLGYLQHADLVVYSYQKTGESSSAAVRMGIAAKRPVAVTPVSIFNDVQSSVFFFSGGNVDDIANGMYDILKLNLLNDPDAIQIKESARLWIAAHGYASVSRQLYWLIIETKSISINYYLPPSFTLSQASDKLGFIGTDSSLKTSVGKSVGECIQTTGKEGCLLFGPFLSVAPGDYRVVIYGSVGESGIGSAIADVAIQSGACILAKDSISTLNEQDVLAVLCFTIPEGGCTDLEVRVWVGDDTDMQISKIEIAPWQENQHIGESQTQEKALIDA